MTRAVAATAVGVLVIGALVFAGGMALARPDARGDVVVGVLVGVGFQLLVLAIAAFAFPGNALAAYGVGLLGRLLLVVVAALVVIPAAGLDPAPFLYSLVSVLFATTVLEPVVMAATAPNRKTR